MSMPAGNLLPKFENLAEPFASDAGNFMSAPSQGAFHDHFSGHAGEYARFRPRYPTSLFAWLADQCDRKTQAWDCGTGNGQAAMGLAEFFDQVLATDASAQQIAAAPPQSRVEFRTATERQSGLATASTDLVTVAQALHWFDTTAFFQEVRRVLRPRGVVAVWCYNLQTLGEPFDALLRHFYTDKVGPYWPPERRLVEEGYRSIDFPFAEISPPHFAMEQQLSLDGLLNYLGTWSASKRFEQTRGFSPIPQLEHDLLPLWGDRHQPRTIAWPLTMRVGRNAA